MTPIPRFQPHRGPAILSSGFRPFFLAGAIFAALAVTIWLPFWEGEISLQTAFAPRDWHAHEMLYGYLPAVITGFLFTAIPNWTGRMPLQGAPLLALVLLWFAGRVATAFSADIGWPTALLIDAAFLAAVVAVIAREIIAGRKWNNLPVVGLTALLFACNVGFHLEAQLTGLADVSIRLGIAVVIMLIGLIGGRIVPSFTRNWLARENPGRLPVPFNRFDAATVAVSALGLVAWVVINEGAIAGGLLGVAGVLHFVRLSRWAGDRTFKDRLVLVLHVGYLFVPIGFWLTSAASFGWLSPSAGIHAWMAGAAGVMTLAVMTRASLGHTGQALVASVSTQAIYAAVAVAALARIGAAVLPGWSFGLLHLTAFAWVAAFAGFAISYGPRLLGHRRLRPPAPQPAAGLPQQNA